MIYAPMWNSGKLEKLFDRGEETYTIPESYFYDSQFSIVKKH